MEVRSLVFPPFWIILNLMKDERIYLIFFIFTLIAILFFPRDLFGREIEINADRMEVFEDEGLAVFTGKVFAKSRDLRLWTEKLYIYYTRGEKRREIQKLIALGGVRIERDKWRSVAGKATYFRDQEKLVLEDSPKVWYEDNLVEGDLIVVYFKEERSEVFSKEGGRVRLKIYER